MNELKIEELLEKAKINDIEALKTLKNYYEEIGDDDNILFYQEKIDSLIKKDSDFTSPARLDEQCDFDYYNEYQKFIDGDYDSLSFSILKTNKENNPYYYEVLAKRYYKGEQFVDSVEYYEKEIKLLEKSKKINNTSLFLALYGIIDALFELINENESNVTLLRNGKYREKYFNYINNALEIDSNDAEVISKKPKLYFYIFECYKNGNGCVQDFEKAKKYDDICSSYNIHGCLKQSVIAHKKRKFVDEDEWLEKAVELNKNINELGFFINGNSEEYQRILDLKILLKDKKENEINIDNFPNKTKQNEDCFTIEEVQTITKLKIFKSTIKCFINCCLNIEKENFNSASLFYKKSIIAHDFKDKTEYQDIAVFLSLIIEGKDKDTIIEYALKFYYAPEYIFVPYFKDFLYKIICETLNNKEDLSVENKKRLLSFTIEHCLKEEKLDAFTLKNSKIVIFPKKFFYDDVLLDGYFEVENFVELDDKEIETIVDLFFLYDKNDFDYLIQELGEEVPLVLEKAKKYDALKNNEQNQFVETINNNETIEKSCESNKIKNDESTYCTYQNPQKVKNVKIVILLLALAIFVFVCCFIKWKQIRIFSVIMLIFIFIIHLKKS